MNWLNIGTLSFAPEVTSYWLNMTSARTKIRQGSGGPRSPGTDCSDQSAAEEDPAVERDRCVLGSRGELIDQPLPEGRIA